MTQAMAHSSVAPQHQRPPTSATYHLPSDSSDSGSDAPLPFPETLPRSDFLVPGFDPAAYLSALPHRHQTLEDLKSDLRDRSGAISSELLELVNSNYTAFLSLGSELKGGDEKVEDVKVALLGFRRAVEEVKARVAEKREEITALNDDFRNVRTKIEHGRDMLELHERLQAMEERLAVGSLPAGNGTAEEDWDSDSSDGSSSPQESLSTSPAKLLRSATEYIGIVRLKDSMDQQHPFVVRQEERLVRCRNTLLLDLGNALKEAKATGVKGQDRMLRYLAIYRLLSAQSEAVKILKGG